MRDRCHIYGRGIKVSEGKQVTEGKIWDTSVLCGLIKTSRIGKGHWSTGICFYQNQNGRLLPITRAFPGTKGASRKEGPLTDKIHYQGMGSEESSNGFRGSSNSPLLMDLKVELPKKEK